MIGERVRGRVGGGEDFKIEPLEEGAGQELGCLQLFVDGVVVEIGGLLGEAFLEAEQLLEGIVEPEARRGAAEEVVVFGEDVPDLARDP